MGDGQKEGVKINQRSVNIYQFIHLIAQTVALIPVD